VYHNASGLPDDEQVTTARDQALLGRMIQERFPREYHYFSTPSFTYHGTIIRNHNHLLGQVEGVDGIKTGYTEASGYNLVTSVHRNGRHIVSVVLGGASAASRDARMRSLIEEYIVAASPQKTSIALAQSAPLTQARRARAEETRNVPEDNPAEVSPQAVARGPVRDNSIAAAPVPSPRSRPLLLATTRKSGRSAEPVERATTEAKPTGAVSVSSEPADDPVKPIHVKTVTVKLSDMTQSGAGASSNTSSAPHTSPVPAPQSAPVIPAEPRRSVVASLANSVAAEQETAPPTSRQGPNAMFSAPVATPGAMTPGAMTPGVMMPWPAAPGTLERSPAISDTSATTPAVARESTPRLALQSPVPQGDAEPDSSQQNRSQTGRAHNTESTAHRAAVHSGWIIQVGAFDVEQDAREKLNAVRAKAANILGHAEPFTEAVMKGDKTFYRARFAGLEKSEAEAVCKQLKRNDMDCIAVKN
jgi:D-alanyl-D-alanine carboxypeptidase